jgi:hypothetical protein
MEVELTVPAGATNIGLYLYAMDAGTYYVDNVFLKRMTDTSLIVDGAVTADKILANTITAGQIATGAIGADEIAANVIAVKHLIVANFENLIPNGNSEQGSLVVGFNPEGSGLVNEPSNAYAGNWCRKLSGSPNSICVTPGGATNTRIQCSAGEEYRFSVMVKCTSGGATFRIYMAFFNSDGGVITAPYTDIETTGSYQSVSVLGIAPSGATNVYFAIESVDAGTYYIDQMIAKRRIDTSLIVDGAITADKLTANHLNAVNTESGTFQQSYTAPGDNNTTPGAGLKITGGNIEAYGSTQTFGGPLIASDGNYMASIGKYLTTTGKGKRYPLNNGTNFTADGKIHLYKWESTVWKPMYGYDDETQLEVTKTSATEETIYTDTVPSDCVAIYEFTLLAISVDSATPPRGSGHTQKGMFSVQNLGGTLSGNYDEWGQVTYIAAQGWATWVISGTSVNLVATNSSGYDVKYQVHIKRSVLTLA